METELSRAVLTNPLLSACAEATRAAVVAAAKVREFTPGETLIGDGEPAGVALFPLQGVLQMSKKTPRGRQQIFCDSTPSACGGLCLLAFGPHSLADVRSITSGLVLMVPAGQFMLLARQDPVLCQGAWQCATTCMAHLSDLVTQLSFKTVSERVVDALLHGTQADGDVVRHTQSELAALVGTTREVVARCLGDLQAAGAIRLGRGRIIVLNRALLAAQA